MILWFIYIIVLWRFLCAVFLFSMVFRISFSFLLFNVFGVLVYFLRCLIRFFFKRSVVNYFLFWLKYFKLYLLLRICSFWMCLVRFASIFFFIIRFLFFELGSSFLSFVIFVLILFIRLLISFFFRVILMFSMFFVVLRVFSYFLDVEIVLRK